uniref:Uncharacterized protein n=1 Tax=viral metagenome TaxID=1070528 RepID=A0A6M3J3M3_9ZZZZ
MDEKGKIKWLALLAPLLGAAGGAAFGGNKGAALGALGGAAATTSFSQGVERQQVRADARFEKEQDRAARKSEREASEETAATRHKEGMAGQFKDPRVRKAYLEGGLDAATAKQKELLGVEAEMSGLAKMISGAKTANVEAEEKAEKEDYIARVEIERETDAVMRLAEKNPKAAKAMAKNSNHKPVQELVPVIDLMKPAGGVSESLMNQIEKSPWKVNLLKGEERQEAMEILAGRGVDLSKISDVPDDPMSAIEAEKFAMAQWTFYHGTPGEENAQEAALWIAARVAELKTPPVPAPPPDPVGEVPGSAEGGEVPDDIVVQTMVDDAKRRGLSEKEVMDELAEIPENEDGLTADEKEEILRRLGFLKGAFGTEVPASARALQKLGQAAKGAVTDAGPLTGLAGLPSMTALANRKPK